MSPENPICWFRCISYWKNRPLLKGTNSLVFSGVYISTKKSIRASFCFVDDAARPNSGRCKGRYEGIASGTTFLWDLRSSQVSPGKVSEITISNWKFSEILTVREWFKMSWTKLQQPIPVPSFKMFFEHTPKFWKKAPWKSKRDFSLSTRGVFDIIQNTWGPLLLNDGNDSLQCRFEPKMRLVWGSLGSKHNISPPKVCGIC